MSEHSGNGKVSTKTWWAGLWMQAFSRWYDPERIAQGSALARQGRVTDLRVAVGLAQGRVLGTDGTEYDVRINVRPFSDEQWRRIISVLAGQAFYTAQLLNGEMPYEIDSVFRAAGVSLFPRTASELTSECTCSDWVRPCTHVVAVFHQLGEMLDSDPFTILTLRGRSREQVMANLRAERAERLGTVELPDPAPEPGEDDLLLSAEPDSFWRMGEELAELRIRVREPEIELELVRILGTPEFARQPDLEDRLEAIYRRVTARALGIAYDGEADE